MLFVTTLSNLNAHVRVLDNPPSGMYPVALEYTVNVRLMAVEAVSFVLGFITVRGSWHTLPV